MNERLKLALVLGSAREGRFCDKIARWAEQEILALGGFELDVIDPVLLDLPKRIESSDGPAVKALVERIDRADAFVVITPEYNHGYPAALKDVIDSAYSQWNAKPVGFISYGGIAGGLRAVEQLRQVFAELHVVTMRDSVSFANPWRAFDDIGELTEPGPARKALAGMIRRLGWWAATLKDARTASPYDQAAASPPASADAVTLVNTFIPRAGKLDEFISLQVEESARLGKAAHAMGWRGNRIYRTRDSQAAVIVTVFESMEAKRRWAETEVFAEHLDRIGPLLDRVESRECDPVAAHGWV